MYKLFIVDDEILVKTQLKMMIPWENMHLSLSGEAANGREAYERISSCIPDIVICDIQMPVMDGLQLCELLRKEYPQIQFIALSNYEDYLYVRGVLSLGGVDYLLKQELSTSYLSDALVKAIERIRKDSDNSITEITGTPGYMEMVKKEFLSGLVNGLYTNSDKIKHQFKVLGLPISFYNLLPIVMKVSGYGKLAAEQKWGEINTQEFAILNICNETLTESYAGITFLASPNIYVTLLSLDSFRSEQKRMEHVQTVVAHIKRNLNKFLNLTVRFSAGTMCATAAELKNSFGYARTNIEQAFYAEQGSLIMQTFSATHNEMILGLEPVYEKKLWKSLTLGESRLMMSVLSEIFDEINEKKLRRENVQMIQNDLLSIISRYGKSEGLDFEDIYYKGVSPYDMLREFETFSEIREWFYNTFQNLLEQANIQKESTNSPHIRQALQIIKKRYREDISQQSVAAEIGISNSYLSSLFNQEIKKGFNEYLSEIRVEKAKQLIRGGNDNFQEVVVSCGFYSYNYFFKVFKKKTGMTPKEYAQKSSSFDFPE